jgi:hypothetical protein
MPLEGIWKQFLNSVKDDAAPLVSAAEYAELMGEDAMSDVQRRLQSAGQTTASCRLQQPNTCISFHSTQVRHGLGRIQLGAVCVLRAHVAPVSCGGASTRLVARHWS